MVLGFTSFLFFAGGTVAVVAAPAVIAAVGFTSAGVAGGSIAAGAQSIFYGGLTTGVFSALQSAGKNQTSMFIVFSVYCILTKQCLIGSPHAQR